jgi:hypothetical protein
MILSTLLHYANREAQFEIETVRVEFYRIKDIVLKKYGTVIGYDVQKIDGKKCWSCDGSGRHYYYSNLPPYKAYDSTDCWSCGGTGYYHLPKWIALHRITYNGYTFHKPLKREQCLRNPFTKEELGWQVTENPIIKGYIEHDRHWFGEYAIMLILLLYKSPLFKTSLNDFIRWKKYKIKRWFHLKFNKQPPTLTATFDSDNCNADELPF